MAPKKKKKADAGPEDDSPEVLAAIEKQKMTVEMDHLSLRMKMLLREQELMTSQKSDMSKTIDKNNFKQEALYKSLNQQINDKECAIEDLRRDLTRSAVDHAAQVEQVLAKMDEEQLSNAKEVSELNQQIQALRERTHRVDDFDLLTAQKDDLSAELQETRDQLENTREELDAWQRQSMVMTQPLYRDSVVLFMLEAIRLYPKQEGLLVEAMAALQNVVSPENPSEILDNCAMIREFGGIGIVLSVMRDHLTKERIQCNACSLLWKLSFWDSENIPVITANGGLHLILAAMTAHPDYAKLQYAAAGVLRAIMGPARAANDRDMRSPSPFMRAPMVEPPVPAHSRNKTPSGGSSRFPMIDQNRGSSRADKLSLIERSPSRATPMPHPDQISDADMAMAWMRMHTHAMQLLLKCMADHHDHEYIQTYAIGALMNIVNSSDAAMMSAGKGGVITAVMGAMRTHSENGELQMVGLRTLTRLVHAKQNRKIVEKSGGKELTRRAMEIHKGNPLVQDAANEMKKYLKSWDDDSDEDGPS